MFSISRTLFTLLFSLSLVSTAIAQTRRPVTQTSSPIVTATTSNGRVRYASLGEVNQTRLQVFSPNGFQVYDSDLRLGNLIDWHLLDQQGQRLTDGSYVFVITVKDFSGVPTQKYGTALLEGEQISLQQTGIDELPASQALALQDNRISEVLSPVDRIGAAGSGVAATTRIERGIVDKAPDTKQKTATSQSAPGGENLGGTGTQNQLAKWTDNAGTLGNSNVTEVASGKLGIGTVNPNYELSLFGNDIGLQLISAATGTTANDGFRFGISSTNNAFLWNTEATDMYFGTTATERMRITAAGNVGIGTNSPTAKLDVTGDVNVTGNAVIAGNIAAKYQDVAEWVQALQPMAPGTVVSLDPRQSNSVMPSRHAYDQLIAGVVSGQPGLILGESGAGKVMVTMSGRVFVKVDAGRYPIRIGDLLVTSNTPGVAMRSRPIRVGGKLIHRPGTIIGKALEALPRGKGSILVLVSLQ